MKNKKFKLKIIKTLVPFSEFCIKKKKGGRKFIELNEAIIRTYKGNLNKNRNTLVICFPTIMLGKIIKLKLSR